MLSLRDKVVGGTVCYRHIVPNGTDSNAGQAVFVVPPLGGIEAATKPQIPVKTGTTNGEDGLLPTCCPKWARR